MAGKAEQNAGGSGEANKPSVIVLEALGDHAEQQGLAQQEGESEIDFAVRAIETLGDLIENMDSSIQSLEAARDDRAESFRNASAKMLAAVNPGADLAALNADETVLDHASRMAVEAALAAMALREERDGLKRQLSSQKGAATKARNTIEEMKEAAKPRKLGPVDLPVDENKQPDLLELKLAIDFADEVVLAFSDGKSEIRGVAPRKVSAEDFKLVRGRVLFDRPDLTVTGPGGEGQGVPQLAGVALLLDGEPFAWSALAQPVDLGAGRTINLTGSVIFG